MARRFEGQFEGYDQKELFFQTWTPESVRGVLIITHGLAEHSECYHSLANALCNDGWLVYAWDLRGHGRSEGKRGYVGSLRETIEDLALFHALVAKSHPEHNLVLFGHSLGGLITVRFVEDKQPRFAALALSSPAMGLSIPVPKIKERLAIFANKWLPTLTMHNEIKYEDLTRDAETIAGYRRDTLRHDKISPGLFLGMVEHFPLAIAGADKITVPTLMQIAGDDRIVSQSAARALFDRLANKKNQLHVYPDSRHEIYNDLERDTVLGDLKKFLQTYLTST